MDKELAKEIARLADNLCDSDFSALSLGIGLGTRRRNSSLLNLDRKKVVQDTFVQAGAKKSDLVLPPLPRIREGSGSSRLAYYFFYFFALIADLTLAMATFLAVAVFFFMYADTQHSLRQMILEMVQKNLGLRFYVALFSGIALFIYAFYFLIFRLLIGSTPGEWAFELKKAKKGQSK